MFFIIRVQFFPITNKAIHLIFLFCRYSCHCVVLLNKKLFSKFAFMVLSQLMLFGLCR